MFTHCIIGSLLLTGIFWCFNYRISALKDRVEDLEEKLDDEYNLTQEFIDRISELEDTLQLAVAKLTRMIDHTNRRISALRDKTAKPLLKINTNVPNRVDGPTDTPATPHTPKSMMFCDNGACCSTLYE